MLEERFYKFSARNVSMSTFSGFNCARDGVLINPTLLNSRSDEELLAWMQRYFHASWQSWQCADISLFYRTFFGSSYLSGFSGFFGFSVFEIWQNRKTAFLKKPKFSGIPKNRRSLVGLEYLPWPKFTSSPSTQSASVWHWASSNCPSSGHFPWRCLGVIIMLVMTKTAPSSFNMKRQRPKVKC